MEPPLVIFHKQLGDLLLVEPGIARLAASYNATVRLSTRAAFLPMVSLMENVAGESGVRISRASQVISLSKTFHAGVKAAATLAPFKKLWVLNPNHLKPWHRLVYPSGATYVQAWDQYRGRYYFDIMPSPKTIEFRPPKLRTPPLAWGHPRLPKEYILLHPTSAWPRKSWPAERWRDVLNELNASGYGPFVITGGSAEWEQTFAKQVCEKSEATTFNIAGQTTLQQYLHAVANAHLVMCIDGSASHLAPAFGRPSISLFGDTSPLVWHLRSGLSSFLAPDPNGPLHEKSINEISTDSVVQLAQKKLGGVTTHID